MQKECKLCYKMYTPNSVGRKRDVCIKCNNRIRQIKSNILSARTEKARTKWEYELEYFLDGYQDE